MQNGKPTLDVWDSCCLIGILNGEKDKLPALLAQTRFFETGAAMMGLPIAVLDEVLTLADGTSAEEKVRAFLMNPYGSSVASQPRSFVQEQEFADAVRQQEYA